MFPLFAIAFQERTGILGYFTSAPPDVILFRLLLVFGWIPILWVVIWGAGQIWLDTRKDLFKSKIKWVMLAISIPRLSEQTPKAMENVFSTLQGTAGTPGWKDKWISGAHGIRNRFSFEIISVGGYIQFYIRCRDSYRDLMEAAIYAQYSDAEIIEIDDYVAEPPVQYPNDEWDVWGTELTLKKPNYFPIRTWPMFEHAMSKDNVLKDPISGVLEQLSRLQPGEQLWIQILTEPSSQEWKDEGEAYIAKEYGIKPKVAPAGPFDMLLKAIFWLPDGILQHVTGISILGALGIVTPAPAAPVKEDKPAAPVDINSPQKKERLEGVGNKIHQIGFPTKIRIIYVGKKTAMKKGHRVAMIKGIFQQYTNQTMNSFGLVPTVTPQDDYFWLKWSYHGRQERIIKAYKARDFGSGASPFILSTEELATLYHFPSFEIKAPLVKKTDSRRAEPPVGLPIAFNDEDNIPLRAPVGKESGSPLSPPKNVPMDAGTNVDIFGSLDISLPPVGTTKVPPVSEMSSPSSVPPIPPADEDPNLQVHLPAISEEKTRQQMKERAIPDALRVLLEPGVELEDVGIKDNDIPEWDDRSSSK